tara:strand:- start:186 stop:512 length:327 start_codon:yes stop_codon:yes gene_type:complete
MRYVVDIDGTICYPGEGDQRYTHATPRWDRIKVMNKLYDEGHEVIYLTARGMGRYNNDRRKAYNVFFHFTADQLDSWGCRYTDLFLGKPSGDIYIDDKGMSDNEFFTT